MTSSAAISSVPKREQSMVTVDMLRGVSWRGERTDLDGLYRLSGGNP